MSLLRGFQYRWCYNSVDMPRLILSLSVASHERSGCGAVGPIASPRLQSNTSSNIVVNHHHQPPPPPSGSPLIFSRLYPLDIDIGDIQCAVCHFLEHRGSCS